jgi:hypothetical protein
MASKTYVNKTIKEKPQMRRGGQFIMLQMKRRDNSVLTTFFKANCEMDPKFQILCFCHNFFYLNKNIFTIDFYLC